MTKKKQKLSAKARAARAPGWIAAAVVSKATASAQQRFKDRKLGTFGPAGPVRFIDPAGYILRHKGDPE